MRAKEFIIEDAFNGIDISIEVEDDEIMVKATSNGRELGHVLFVDEGEYLMPQDLEVDERYQGQGIAATMYNYVKSKGYKIRRSGQQTDAGAGFWAKHRPEQNVWEQSVAEGVPQPGKSSGKPISWIDPTKVVTKYLTLDEIFKSVSGIPYYNNVVTDRDNKDFTWGVTKRVIQYAKELVIRPDTYKNWPPIIVLDGKLQDGAHRISTIYLMQQRVQPNNPIWKNAKLKVEFGTSDNVKQGVAEEVNPEILSTKHTLPTENITMGNYEFNARIYTGENPGLQIRAYDPKLRQGIQLIGNAYFVVHKDEKGNTWLESDDTVVRPSYYGKGVAAMMYAFAKSLGNDIKPSDIQEPLGKKMWKKWGKDAKNLVGEQGVAENAENLHIGDPIIITGKGIEFEGTTGEIVSFGQQNRFVVVNLYNHGKHSFHSSDVSYNEYAGSDEEEARAYDSDSDARNWNMDEQGVAEGQGEQISKTKALNSLRKELMNSYEYMKCANLEEFKHRLQWLSEGMLKNHMTDGKSTVINREEIKIYQEYRKKREQIQRGLTQGVAEDWNKVNHHDKTDGLSQKAVNAYRREHPGSKLKTAVTTKPSKLKAGSKDAKRRKSFCARMSGNKGPMKDEHGKPTPKAKALRRWNCE